MIAFEVLVNEQKSCVAGVDGPGVVSAILTWATRIPKTGPEDQSYPPQELTLIVGGLRNVESDHVYWAKHSLEVGDVVTLKIKDLPAVDTPSSSTPLESPDAVREMRRRQYEELKKRIRWLTYLHGTQQIVGPERRGRVSHQAWCGER